MTTQQVRVGADALWVEDSGGDGPPLVLLHPGIADSRSWDRLVPLLAEHRVIRFDRRGFGRSPVATEPFRPVDDLVAVLDHLGVPTAHLVGNSMGGETALALAVTDPARVASLTLLCPGIGGYPWPEPTPEELATFERYQAAHDAGDVAAMAALGLEEWCACGSDDYLEEQLRATTEADLAQTELEQANPEQWDALPGVTVPTTVVAGEQDPAESLAASLAIADRIPGADLVRLDVDHLPQYRDPAATATAVLATVARGSRSGD
ncbi:MAG: alpha/beta hydrolase [Marmoricola sp.]